MVKYMNLQLRMETFLGTQSNGKKLGAGTTKTEVSHMVHTQIRDMANLHLKDFMAVDKTLGEKLFSGGWKSNLRWVFVHLTHFLQLHLQ